MDATRRPRSQPQAHHQYMAHGLRTGPIHIHQTFQSTTATILKYAEIGGDAY